ncbi:hypothetical protein BKA57DRAFT_460212 [Linnemannia elongata]|nr:hypothetical protein BKA57DRAFT_460212 [Linnemannia elongata]
MGKLKNISNIIVLLMLVSITLAALPDAFKGVPHAKLWGVIKACGSKLNCVAGCIGPGGDPVCYVDCLTSCGCNASCSANLCVACGGMNPACFTNCLA